jgi:hypothetical protein
MLLLTSSSFHVLVEWTGLDKHTGAQVGWLHRFY